MPPSHEGTLIYPHNNSKVSRNNIAFKWATVPLAGKYLCSLYVLQESRGAGAHLDLEIDRVLERPGALDTSHMVWTIVTSFTQEQTGNGLIQETKKLKLTPGRKYAFVVDAFRMGATNIDGLRPKQVPVIPLSSVAEPELPKLPGSIFTCRSSFGVKAEVNRLEQYLKRDNKPISSVFIPLFFHTLERYRQYKTNPDADHWTQYEMDFFHALERGVPEINTLENIEIPLSNWRKISNKNQIFDQIINLDTPQGVEGAIARVTTEIEPIKKLVGAIKSNPLKYSIQFPDLNVDVPAHELTARNTFTFTARQEDRNDLNNTNKFYIKLFAGEEERIINCQKVSMNDGSGECTVSFSAIELRNLNCTMYRAEFGRVVSLPPPTIPPLRPRKDRTGKSIIPPVHGEGRVQYIPINKKDGYFALRGGAPVIIGCDPVAFEENDVIKLEIKVANADPSHQGCFSISKKGQSFRGDELSVITEDQTFQYEVLRWELDLSGDSYDNSGQWELRYFYGSTIIESLNSTKIFIKKPLYYEVSNEGIYCFDESNPEGWGDDTICWMSTAITSQLISTPHNSDCYGGMHQGLTLDPEEIADPDKILFKRNVVAGFLQIDFTLMEYDDLGILADIINGLIDAFQSFIISLIESGLNLLCPPAGTVCGYLIKGLLEISGFNDWRSNQVEAMVSGWEIELLGEAQIYKTIDEIRPEKGTVEITRSDCHYQLRYQVSVTSEQ